MSLPKNLRNRYLLRFDELIEEGKNLVDSIKVIPPHTNGSYHITYTTYNTDVQRYGRWKTNCLSLFDTFVKNGSKLKEQVDVFSKINGKKAEVEYSLGIIEAIRDDFETGFLDDLAIKIEAEVASDYMSQAEDLLNDEYIAHCNHIPAAVLSGVVLEKALRTLCQQQQPPVPILNEKGQPKMLNLLIEGLKTAGLFNEVKAKQLRSWADIRNKAAHGQFEDFKKTDVELMIRGIGNFLGEHLA